MRLVPNPVGRGRMDLQAVTELLASCSSIIPDTPQIQSHADTVSPLQVRDNLDSRNRSKEQDSAEVACGTLTATLLQPARPSLAYGGPDGN